jgi:hypothetical protein
MKFCREVMPFKGTSEAVSFNPIASTILKWLRFKFQIFTFAQQWFGIGNTACILPKGLKLY